MSEELERTPVEQPNQDAEKMGAGWWVLIVIALIGVGLIVISEIRNDLTDGGTAGETERDIEAKCISAVESGIKQVISSQGIYDPYDCTYTPTGIEENNRGNFVVSVKVAGRDEFGQIHNDYFFGETTKEAKLLKIMHQSGTSWDF